tara:strand:+ start:471 stop:854 length:384 start_codon:yes stop_codon:yes gene_type:complete
MEISVWLTIALAISAFLNVVFFWLLREQSSRLSIIADNSFDLIELISSFRDHVKAVYSLDSFYGDETLEGLMAHARSLTSLLEEQYGDIADLAEQIEYQNEEIEEDAQKEEEKEQHVLYGGTRASNN